MIAIAGPERADAVKKALTEAGGQVMEVATNVEGVRVE
jgi:nitrogen regulatory protein PII